MPGQGGPDGLTTWTGPRIAQAHVSANGDSIVLEFESSSATSMSLRDVKAANIDGSRNDCTRCCAGEPPFEVTANGLNWTRVARESVAIQNSIVQLEIGDAQGVQQVRYGWQNYVECVLQNEDQLPAVPFLRSAKQYAPKVLMQL